MELETLGHLSPVGFYDKSLILFYFERDIFKGIFKMGIILFGGLNN